MNNKNHRILLVSILLIIQVFSIQFSGFSKNPDKEILTNPDEGIKVSIIYDNYDFKDGMKSDWGFSCLIEGTEKTILFDAGAKKKVFKQNIEALKIDVNKIQCAVISHDHFDHTGGLETILEMNNNISVYMLESFSGNVKEIVTKNEGDILYEPALKEICKNVYLSGVIGERIEEQSLAISTPKGLVVITGCSHSGIVRILEHFKSNLNQEIYLVFGGFHLMRKNENEMNAIIQEMKEMGVKKCGATHCTGKKQIDLFKDAFGENYVKMGVGNIIEF